MTTSETGDLLVRSHVRWTRKLMVAALRAFTCSSGEKSSHLHKPIYRGDRCTSKRGIRHKASQRSPARPLGALVLRGRGNGLRRSPRQRGGQGDVAGRISARSCKHLRKIGDCTAKLVGFQFKERVDQARAMGGKRHIDEGRRFDLFGILCAGWEFVKKNTGRRTFSTAAICTIMAALMRLVPASYFCTCRKLTPRALARSSWLTLGTIVRRRACSFSPKCTSSDPVDRGPPCLMTGLAFFLALKDHPQL
jgi:hypothetical protein